MFRKFGESSISKNHDAGLTMEMPFMSKTVASNEEVRHFVAVMACDKFGP